MRLVYLSPVPWSSFAQRPHKFVEWFHARADGDVLWIDPYPTRFPMLADFRRFGSQEVSRNAALPQWMTVARPTALPIEPLPGSGWLNGLMWRRMIREVAAFAAKSPTMLVVGKPSILALMIQRQLENCRSVYDAMDDFPAFYDGFSRLAMRQRERQLMRSVSGALVSSTVLERRWRDARPDLQLVKNGLDADALPAEMQSRLPLEDVTVSGSKKVFGYVGTIAAWFDWDWVIALARARPGDVVRLIGPIFSTAPDSLPGNIEMLPPRHHRSALLAVRDFDVGLIPFRKNRLTDSVDPIKYYEYRALGVPVVSTDFGEMAFRKGEKGTFISLGTDDLNATVQRALSHRSNAEEVRRFIACNTWEARFDAARIL